MPAEKEPRLLTGAMKDAVISFVRKSDPRQPRSAQTGTERSWTAKDFSSLPSHQALKKQWAAGEMLGISNPFFRTHDDRAGATTRIAGQEVINFGSYDYIGMNQDPRVIDAAKKALDHYGVSASGSRPTSGERPIHRALERKLAEVTGTEDAVVFVSGHATNVSAIGELMTPKDLIITDQLVHNSALVGAELSGAARRSFAHNDLDALERLLAGTRGQFENALIIVEGLYSMDGDMPDLARLVAIKRRHGAWLMVDEAHALGVLGRRGTGIAEHQGVNPRDVDIWMGTLSKACAACGGYIAGSRALIDIMKCQSSGFVYSVAMPPSIAAAALTALEIMAAEPERVARLQSNSRFFLDAARAAGLDTGHAQGFAVVPVMVGDSLRAVKLVERLLERGINVVPIIYPAVPMQSARLRFFITSEHTEAQLSFAAKATKEELDRLMGEKFGLSAVAATLIAANERAG